MAEFPALPLFTDAFIADTVHLNAQQTGAYLMLLMAAWRSPDCKLPDDDKILARYARMEGRQWYANKEIIMAFWKRGGDQKWYQRRLLDERKRVEDIRNKNVQAGKASALKRHERGSTPVPTETQPQTNESITLNQISKNTHSSATTPRDPVEDPPPCVFSEFWKARPGRGTLAESEDEARKEFEKLTAAGADGQQLVTAMTRYAEVVREQRAGGTAPRYAKTAGGFLRDGVWKQYANMPASSQPPALSDIPDWQRPLLKHITEQEVRSWFRGATLEGKRLTARSNPAAAFIRQRYDIAIGKVFGDGVEVTA